MLGKLYINEHDYQAAKLNFEEIIASNLYQLTTHIGDNFDLEHEFNSESIFEVSFSIEAKPGTSGGAQDGPLGSEATSRAITLASTDGGGYRSIMPSYYMTMLFMNDTMDMTNPVNADRTGNAEYSIRASYSIAISNDDNTTLYQKESGKGATYGNNEASYLKKFQNWTWEKESELSISGINERVIRYADILLLHAECLIQTNGSLPEALAAVNQIRNRAGVVLLDAADYDPDTLMEHIMWTERPLELMFEGHDIRWEDLTRWGKIKEQYTRLANIEYVFVNKVLELYDPLVHASSTPFKEFEDARDNYNPVLDDYFPIPSTELTSNPFF